MRSAGRSANHLLLRTVLLPRTCVLKPAHPPCGVPMSGIYMILVFVAVMAALNRFEFGRFD